MLTFRSIKNRNVYNIQKLIFYIKINNKSNILIDR